jgi:hypothetical protein
MSVRFLTFALLLPALPCAAQQTDVSTAAAAAQGPSPLVLNISKDARMSRVGLDYSIKWDFSDLASFRPSLGAVYEGVKAVYSWDITENTMVNYYGLRTNPWRMIIARDKIQTSSTQGSGGGETGVVSKTPSAYRKRVRLSVSPLVDDIKRDFDSNLADFLLRSSLSKASPEWEKIGAQNRKAFVKDVLSLPVWAAPVPGMEQTKEGLEYLGGPPKPVKK